MATLETGSRVPAQGRKWIAERLTVGAEPLYYVAMGTGKGPVADNDEEMGNEILRQNVTSENTQLWRAEDGEGIVARISVQGGTDVSAGKELTELGVLTKDERLVYREVMQPIEIAQGIRRSIQSPIQIFDAEQVS